MFSAEHIPYHQANAFSKIVLDYLNGSENLRPFYDAPPSKGTIEQLITKKKTQPVDRKVLVDVLKQQYQKIQASELVRKNIEALSSENTFTVCTAHQPNLFTGPLYFVYKVLHAIRVAAWLKEQLPSYHFVPVYYMGSEDADFAELNHTYVDGKKLEWRKDQKGAVGRMTVDGTLMRLIDELEGQLSSEAYGKEVIGLLRSCYSNGKDIQTATFELVNELYGQWGLIVLIPDHPALKRSMQKVFEEDLFQHKAFEIVSKTSERLSEHYAAQAHPREINLFYLKDDIRERIEKHGDHFNVCNTEIGFSKDELIKELEEHPERFSPNVILRGLFQETILPNLAFIGGGGEMAYWLQLKDLFDHYKVVYPALVLRNSFLIVEKKWQERIHKLGLSTPDLFQTEDNLMKAMVRKYSQHPVSLNGNFEKAEALFDHIRSQAASIDETLSKHVAAIKARSLKDLAELEKKMLRAEKRKYSDQQGQIEKIRAALFPNNGLQERVENFSWFYSRWGRRFIEGLYENSLALEQQFCILMEE